MRGAISALALAAFTAGAALAQNIGPAIPAQGLPAALEAFSAQTGWQLSYPSAAVAGFNAPALDGSMPPGEALAALVDGTGLTVTLTGEAAAFISAPAAAVSGEGSDFVLGAVNVTARGAPGAVWDGSAETVYQTAGSVAAIDTARLETFRGAAPADLLRSAPGVFSGEARNSGGLDVNIRGLQGPRVAVTVDDTANSTSLYRGYQGISNRSYIDPDFIAGVSIDKGPGNAPGAIGGTVAMRTYGVNDLVAPGETFGLRSRLEFSGNVSRPDFGGAGTIGRPAIDQGYVRADGDVPAASGLGGFSESVLMGWRGDNLDVVLGFARRSTGNYHAGSTGDDAPQAMACPVDLGICDYYPDADYYTPGLTSLLPGEEVPNTSMDNASMIGKVDWRIAPDHLLSFGFSSYESAHGETQPAWLWNNGQTMTQGPLSGVDLLSRNLTYRRNPDSRLIDLKATLWDTRMHAVNSTSNTSISSTDGAQWGVDIGNTSSFDIAGGSAVLHYGLTYGYEATRPTEGSYEPYPQRWGHRETDSIYLNALWEPLDWLTVTAGLRNHGFEVANDRIYTVPSTPVEGQTDSRATDYSLGVTAQVTDGLQLFATYDEATRFPSIFEAVGGMAISVDPELGGERARSIEIGANYRRDGLFSGGDRLDLKLGFFANSVDDYIFRENRRYCAYLYNGNCYYWAPNLTLTNLDQMNVSGAELQASYRNGAFAADLNATRYSQIEFCRTEDDCRNETIGGDYATNQVPPEYSFSLNLAQRFLDDRLGLATRITHVGPRGAGAGPTDGGAQPFIALVDWQPYTTLDVQADYRFGNGVGVYAAIDNLADTYHAEPLSMALLPAPGRTLRLGVTAAIGGGAAPGSAVAGPATTGWSGFQLGLAVDRSRLTHSADGFFRASTPERNGAGEVRHLDPAYETGAALRLGWNHAFDSGLVLGLSGEFSPGETTARLDITEEAYRATVSDAATVTARAGVATGDLLVYGLVGLGSAEVSSTFNRYMDLGEWGTLDQWFGNSERRVAVVAGFGAEYALDADWSVFGEFRHMDFGGGKDWTDVARNNIADQDEYAGWSDNVALDQLRFGVNYRF